MATLSPYAFIQELDDDGNPLAGGKIYTYEAGTSTPKATYTSSDETTANANPVILDASGRAEIWLATGNYKFALYNSSDVLIKEVDDIAGQSTGGIVSYDISANTSITELYDRARLYVTGTTTLSLLPVADASDGFEFWVYNDGVATVTIDPDASETINGASTLTVSAGNWAAISCDGDEWYAFDKGTIDTNDIENNAVTLVKMADGVQGDVLYYGASGAPSRLVAGTQGQVLQTQGASANPQWASVLSLTRGLVPSLAADADHDVTVSAGSIADSTYASDLVLPSAMTKRIDATWAAGTGNGGLFSGSVATSTWYHLFIIEKDSDGSIDIGWDTSISAANIPSGYTKYRRVHSNLTDGSSNLVSFVSRETAGGGLYTRWSTIPSANQNGAVSSGVTTTVTLTTPTGYVTEAELNAYSTGANVEGYAFPLDVTAQTPSTGGSPLGNFGDLSPSQLFIHTNTSAQVGIRLNNGETLVVTTAGWKDARTA